jgi:hypothetical protein
MIMWKQIIVAYFKGYDESIPHLSNDTKLKELTAGTNDIVVESVYSAVRTDGLIPYINQIMFSL